MVRQKESSINPEQYWAQFKEIIKYIEAAMGRDFTEERVAIYLEHLQEFSIEEIWEGAKRAVHEETYSQIPPVGKIIQIIEDNREEKRERWPRLGYKEEWPDTPIERVKELVQPFYDKLERQKREISEEGRENRWKENKDKLQKQISLVKQNAGPAEKT